MNTQILQPTEENISYCASVLRLGGLVAFPTETVYALGAVATDARAVGRVFDVKGRPKDRPLIVAVANRTEIPKIVKSVPPKAKKLIDALMPGALTVLFDKADCIPDVVTAGAESVAVRIPDNPVAQKLMKFARAPVVVPSANTSDGPSPTLASHVLDDLNGKIGYILDGGPSEIGIESTVIDVRGEVPLILRGGGVTAEAIEKVIGRVAFKREAPASDYMPRAEVLFSAYYGGMPDNIRRRYDEVFANGRAAVILCLDGNEIEYAGRRTYRVGADYAEYAHNLFALLRRADAEHIDTVIAEGVKPEGIGASLINRLIKISRGQII